MQSEVVKLYPEPEGEIELSYPTGHRVVIQAISFENILRIGKVLKDSLLAFSDKANEEKNVLEFFLELTPEVTQKVLRLAYEDEVIEVGKLKAVEVVGLLQKAVDTNDGLKKGVEGFFAPYGGVKKVLALLQLSSFPASSPTATPSEPSSTGTPTIK